MKEKPPLKHPEGVLQPTKEVFKVEGRVSYQESAGAWTAIKIKKDILLMYPQLGEKRSKFNYKLIVPRTLEEVKKQFEELEKDNTKIPILLFFEKDNQIPQETLR